MNNIKELLKRAGMQQKELASLCGVSQPTVSDWINDKKTPSGQNLMRLAEIFNVGSGVVLGYSKVDGDNIPTEINAFRDIQDAHAELNMDAQSRLMLQKYHMLTPENQIRVSAYIEGILSGQGS